MNKKGFTLIELLAVIVVLAIVLVVTIPSVLSSMDKAKTEQFNNAVATVEEYIKKQMEACKFGDEKLVRYDSDIFLDGECRIDFTKEKEILANAGYSMNYSLNFSNDDVCDATNENSDFCSLSLNSDGSIEYAISPVKSKFGSKCFATEACINK